MQKLFELYAAAFLSVDPANVSTFYNFPVTFYTETGDVVILEENAFLENTHKLFATYKELGVRKVEFQILDQKNTNNLFKLVTIEWSFSGADGAEIYSAVTRYLVQTESMKIASVTVVDEMGKISELLKN